jgi:hypothetical protein
MRCAVNGQWALLRNGTNPMSLIAEQSINKKITFLCNVKCHLRFYKMSPFNLHWVTSIQSACSRPTPFHKDNHYWHHYQWLGLDCSCYKDWNCSIFLRASLAFSTHLLHPWTIFEILSIYLYKKIFSSLLLVVVLIILLSAISVSSVLSSLCLAHYPSCIWRPLCKTK